ncbi:MAG: glycogen/starch/alpha-glucan phosphorylase [Eubacteriales bacterium]|nr:glycogen/starch/alpha-glucan phosphorylase [Eubacteriales bacterium]
MEKNVKEEIKKALESKVSRYFGCALTDATETQIYKSVILTVRDILTNKKAEYKKAIKKNHPKRVYYLCMEFLIGRSLKNNLRNLGLADEYASVLSDLGFDIEKLYAREPDPGLGNGGLGRLAACFMDALTTQDYPAMGFSICYEYGLFKQRIVDGSQVELPDVWMDGAGVWLVPRTDKTMSIRFGGTVSENWNNGRCEIVNTDYEEIQAVPYDMMISGADCSAVSTLRLWKAENVNNFNMKLFSQGEYIKAMEENNNAEVISKVLYPADATPEGKMLRLSQQYFFVSASLQSIIADHLAMYGTLRNFSEKVAIHINDTHPAVCIPEMMRIFMDIYSYSWEDAWNIVKSTVSYTNHTVMPEALECWNENIFRLRLPRLYMIIEEINRRFCADMWNLYPGDWDRISRMAVIANGQVRMANLSVIGSHTVNGVSKLHSEILKDTVFHDYYKAMPDKFTNVTNGIAHRRWLCYSNPGLTALLDETVGTQYRKQPETLKKFEAFKDDRSVLSRLEAIKKENKINFSNRILEKTGEKIDPNSIFDVQVKRMHEYKRQLLNALKIINRCLEIRDDPNGNYEPMTFVFGGKAAPSYYMAKNIISLIWNLGKDIDGDELLRKFIKVIYLEDYNVSTAEALMPASDISEQISLAGKEASGTGCMKFMINGALTLGTLDGANVEMKDAVGDENIYIFGLNAKEVEDLWRNGYVSAKYYMSNARLRATIDRISEGFNGKDFSNIATYLTSTNGVADPYMCLADYESYKNTFDRMISDYSDRDAWLKKSLVNIANSGYFSADRSIREYAENIWHIAPVK